MDLHIRSIQRRIPLLPDAELLRMIDEMLAAPAPLKRSIDRGEQTRCARQIEAIRREIKARGMSHPPWWSANRDWEVEERPVRALNRARVRPSDS